MTDDETKAMQDTMFYGTGILRDGKRIDPTKVVFRTGFKQGFDLSTPSPVFRLKAGEPLPSVVDLLRGTTRILDELDTHAMVEHWRKLHPAISAAWLKGDFTEEPMNGYTIIPATNGGFIVRQERPEDRGMYFPSAEFAGTLDECLSFVGDKFRAAEAERKAAEAQKATDAKREARIAAIRRGEMDYSAD